MGNDSIQEQKNQPCNPLNWKHNGMPIRGIIRDPQQLQHPSTIMVGMAVNGDWQNPLDYFRKIGGASAEHPVVYKAAYQMAIQIV